MISNFSCHNTFSLEFLFQYRQTAYVLRFKTSLLILLSMSNPNKDLNPPALVKKQSRRKKNKVVERNPSDVVRTESPEVHIQLESMVNEDFQSSQGTFDGNNTIANYLRKAAKNSFSDVFTHTTKYLKKKIKETDEQGKSGNGGRDKKHNFLRSTSINLKHPLVNKERLNHSVYLDEEDDQQVSFEYFQSFMRISLSLIS